MEAEISSRIFVQAVSVLWHKVVLGLVHKKYREGGQVGYQQSYNVARSALLTVNRPKIPKILFFIECLRQATVEVLTVTGRKQHVTWKMHVPEGALTGIKLMY